MLRGGPETSIVFALFQNIGLLYPIIRWPGPPRFSLSLRGVIRAIILRQHNTVLELERRGVARFDMRVSRRLTVIAQF